MCGDTQRLPSNLPMWVRASSRTELRLGAARFLRVPSLGEGNLCLRREGETHTLTVELSSAPALKPVRMELVEARRPLPLSSSRAVMARNRCQARSTSASGQRSPPLHRPGQDVSHSIKPMEPKDRGLCAAPLRTAQVSTERSSKISNWAASTKDSSHTPRPRGRQRDPSCGSFLQENSSTVRPWHPPPRCRGSSGASAGRGYWC
jgi:hypothetical protein